MFVDIGRGSDMWAAAERVALLETLIVLHHARGQGVGWMLMDAMFAELRARGVSEWRVGVVTSNKRALAFTSATASCQA